MYVVPGVLYVVLGAVYVVLGVEYVAEGAAARRPLQAARRPAAARTPTIAIAFFTGLLRVSALRRMLGASAGSCVCG